MQGISRREFILGAASCTAMLSTSAAFAATSPADKDEAIAIIDASVDTTNFISELEQAGVQVVIRYLARGCQPEKNLNLAYKRIAYNPPQNPEEACGDNIFKTGFRGGSEYELLADKFALLSAYQYHNDDPFKFVYGLDDAKDKITKLPTTQYAAARVEAQLDAAAALEQSKRIGQPDEAPIYFGVDLDLIRATKSSDRVMNLGGTHSVDAQLAEDACLVYFQTLKEFIGHRLGVYGNGYINRRLLEEDLVKFSWISESRSFAETALFLRKGITLQNGQKKEWHLFQHLINARWFDKRSKSGCKPGLELDGNLQNPTYNYFAAWKGNALWRPDMNRVSQIFKAHHVAKRNAPVFLSPRKGATCIGSTECPHLANMASYHRSVRVHGNEIVVDGETWLHVDMNDDGNPDGYCLATDFVKNVKEMPDYNSADYKRPAIKCTTPRLVRHSGALVRP